MVLSDLRDEKRRRAQVADVAIDDVDQWEDANGSWRKETRHSGNIRMWDNLEAHWSEPISEEAAHKIYLKMVVLYCSACGSTGTVNGQVDQHIALVRQKVSDHADAELQPFARDGNSGQVCTACGGEFLLRKNQGQRHIESYSQSIGDAHVDAREERTMRYGLEPRATAVVSATPVPAELQGSRTPRHAPGKQRRGRRGGRRHK